MDADKALAWMVIAAVSCGSLALAIFAWREMSKEQRETFVFASIFAIFCIAVIVAFTWAVNTVSR